MKPLNTFYDTLQVARSANDTVIQTAFKTLCAKYHPDQDPDDLEGATPEMRLLAEAYAVLSDSEKRFAYDLSLAKRERELRAEEEAKAAKAASTMFPPIEMPPDLPELPPAPAAMTTAATAPVPAKVSPSPVANPARVPPPPSPSPARAPLDFAPTATEPPPSQQAAFADTQPQMEADPLQMCTVREAPLPGNPVLEWLRERPAAMVGVLVLGIALVALAPWMLRVLHMATRSEQPITPDLQPTYVEPPLVPVSAPAVVVPPALPEVATAEPAPAPAADAATAAAAVAGANAAAEPSKAVRSPKRAPASRAKPAVAKKALEPETPARPTEPAPAAPVLDPGGHSGFAPKCRWVTPVKWSCD